MSSILEKEIYDLEFDDMETKNLMVSCADKFVAQGIEAIGMSAIDFSNIFEEPVWLWTMFLSLIPVKNYINSIIIGVNEANYNKAVLEIMKGDTSASDVSRLKALAEMIEKNKQQNNGQVYIITRVPDKKSKYDD